MFLHCSDIYIFKTFSKETNINHTEGNIAGPNREKKHGFFSVIQTLNWSKLIKNTGCNETT
jgi:hypothetical protein